MVVVVFTRNA